MGNPEVASSDRILENSARAFLAAAELGVTHFETDVRASRDGVPVLWHDETLERANGTRARIMDLDWAELRSLKFGSDRLLRLEEVFDAFPHAKFNVDLKTESVLEPAVRAIQSTNSTERVLIASFTDSRRVRAQYMLPGLVASPGMSALARMRFAAGSPALKDRQWRRVLDGAVALQVPVTWNGVTILTDEFIERAHSHGLAVHVWTINDAEEMRALWERGVDAVVTDRSDLAVAAAAEFPFESTTDD